ncbi:MAG: elongation factor G, partial [Actinomycetota bacterium]|nr:elongation factor G [Actinomycetota bacterium]
MKSFPPAKIRNVAFVGHGGSGKTSLSEAMLFCAGAISRQGRVEDGSTTTDYEPEEIKRGISLSLSLAPFGHDGFKLNIIDTPGYADFIGDVETALRVADLAVIVVSAVEGPEVQTEAAWRLAAERNIPRMFFVNKLDRERASFDRTLDQLRELFGAGVAPLELPVGEEAGFRGIADLLTDTAFFYEGQSAPRQAEIPDEIADIEAKTHDNLVEGIVVADDDLMERYLEGDTITPKELEDTLAKGVAEASVFPVTCGSATKMIGIDRIITLICEVGPSPLDRPPAQVAAGGSLTDVACDPSGPPLAVVYRTLDDRYVGKVSFLKVLSGTVRPDSQLTNPRSHSEERLHALFTMRGKEHDAVAELVAGDLGAVAKLGATSTGDTLAPKGTPVVVQWDEALAPVLSIAVKPRSKGDEDKLMTSLHRLQEEDLALRVRRDDETHQTLLSGMGDTHLSIVTERLSRKFGVEVDTEDVRIPYRETITGSAEAE